MKLTAKGPHVFVRPDRLPEQSESGLHLVYDHQDSTVTGTVEAVGDGPEFARAAVDGILDAIEERGGDVQGIRDTYLLDHLVKPGDRIIFSPHAGRELFFERDLLICLKEDDILAVVG